MRAGRCPEKCSGRCVRVPRPGPRIRPAAWGAGHGEAATDKPIPDSYFEKASFLKACPQHGECYGIWEKDKNPCSDSLQSDMNIACDEAKPVGMLECQNYANLRHGHTDLH